MPREVDRDIEGPVVSATAPPPPELLRAVAVPVPEIGDEAGTIDGAPSFTGESG
jgi:hypothetical protein